MEIDIRFWGSGQLAGFETDLESIEFGSCPALGFRVSLWIEVTRKTGRYGQPRVARPSDQTLLRPATEASATTADDQLAIELDIEILLLPLPG